MGKRTRTTGARRRRKEDPVGEATAGMGVLGLAAAEGDVGEEDDGSGGKDGKGDEQEQEAESRMWRTCLSNFYWVHNVEKLGDVTSTLEKYEGKEV